MILLLPEVTESIKDFIICSIGFQIDGFIQTLFSLIRQFIMILAILFIAGGLETIFTFIRILLF